MNHRESFLVISGGQEPQQVAQKGEIERLWAGFKLYVERMKPQPKLPPPPVEDE